MTERRTGGVGPRLALLLALVIAVGIGSRSITDENAVSLQGDMPRYLMNAAFLQDTLLSGNWKPADLLDFAYHYYAKYPALSIGHHPPLLPIMVVPFYAAFGVSVFSARLAVLISAVVAVLVLFLLVRRYYDGRTAGWAALLFASTPTIGYFSQQVLAEMPTIALVLGALYFIERFRESGRARDYLFFIVCAAISLFARQTAVFMFPAYLVLLLMDGGMKRLKHRTPAIITIVGGVLFACAAAATLVLSPFNADVVWGTMRSHLDMDRLIDVLRVIHRDHPTPWLLITSAAALVAAVMTRDGRVLRPIVWIVSVIVCVVVMTGRIEPARYSVVAMPALAVLGASLAAYPGAVPWRTAATVLLSCAVIAQLWMGRNTQPVGASGYEQAAQFVLDQGGAPTVMFSAPIDTGYFVFFVRKHDPEGRLVVLRSDKIFTTSLMADLSVEDRISSPDEIEPILQRFGTRFVVIEDRPSGSVVLDWLRDLAGTDRFAERRRFPTNSRDPRLKGVSVAVYEYLEARPAAADAVIDLDVPLAGRHISLPLASLTSPGS